METEIVVNQRIYPIEAILGTAYVFLDRCYVLLKRKDRNEVVVRLRSRPDCGALEFDAVVGEFENELLNQALRLKVALRTGAVRDAIVHRALFSAMPESVKLDLEGDDGDYLEDPLGIASPWEEKYGKKE